MNAAVDRVSRPWRALLAMSWRELERMCTTSNVNYIIFVFQGSWTVDCIARASELFYCSGAKSSTCMFSHASLTVAPYCEVI